MRRRHREGSVLSGQPAGEITRLLGGWSSGDRAAGATVLPLVYGRLRRLAGAHLRGERSDHTLQATALVHEAYLRLVHQRRTAWRDRSHFFHLAGRLMRRVLLDHARRRGAFRRGGGAAREGLDEAAVASTPGRQPTLLALEGALAELAAVDPEAARVVDLRFFHGLTVAETAAATGLAPRTVDRRWRVARAWLYRELGRAADEAPCERPSCPRPRLAARFGAHAFT